MVEKYNLVYPVCPCSLLFFGFKSLLELVSSFRYQVSPFAPLPLFICVYSCVFVVPRFCPVSAPPFHENPLDDNQIRHILNVENKGIVRLAQADE